MAFHPAYAVEFRYDDETIHLISGNEAGRLPHGTQKRNNQMAWNAGFEAVCAHLLFLPNLFFVVYTNLYIIAN